MNSLKILTLFLVCQLMASIAWAQPSAEDITASHKEYDLANVAMMKKQDAEAYEHLKKAATLDPTNSTYNNSAGYMAMHLGEFETSLEYLNTALALDSEKFGDGHPNVASILNNMGSVYSKMGDSKKAVDYYDRAYAIIADFLGENHPQVQTVKKIRDDEAAKLN